MCASHFNVKISNFVMSILLQKAYFLSFMAKDYKGLLNWKEFLKKELRKSEKIYTISDPFLCIFYSYYEFIMRGVFMLFQNSSRLESLCRIPFIE